MPIPRSVAACALAVVALNLVDASCTLHHVAGGAEELNPLMAMLLDMGPLAFVTGKHFLACAGILGICAHSDHPTARLVLRWLLLPVYVAIAVYQVTLFAVI